MTKTVDVDEPTEYMGGVTTRFVEVNITDYDDASAGNGESFTPADVSMRRFQTVIAEVNEDNGYTANYDEDEQSIRLYDGGTEVTGGSGNSARLRLVCLGR